MVVYNYYSNFELVRCESNGIVSGFLSPNGTFEECGWGEHTDLAYEILKRDNLYEEYRKSRYYWRESARDFLIRRKFYILFDNPSRNESTQNVIFNPFVRRTKSQLNKLFELIENNKQLTEIMMQKIYEKETKNAY